MSLSICIFGGERLDYLELQLQSIKEFVPYDELCYVEGPLYHYSPSASQLEYHDSLPEGVKSIRLSYEDVRPDTRKQRLQECIPAALKQVETDYALFLHGDLFLTQPFEVGEVLDGADVAIPKSGGVQWALVGKDLQDSYFNLLAGKSELHVTPHPVTSLHQSQWDVSFNGDESLPRIPAFQSQIYSPCFLHMDNYSFDFQKVIDYKVEAMRRFLS